MSQPGDRRRQAHASPSPSRSAPTSTSRRCWSQNRVAIAEPRLPEEVRRLGVTVRKNSPDMLMVIHLSSPDGSRDQLYISNYATLQVKDVLARLDGVGDVRIFGARDYAMRIWLDPDKVAARNLTAGEVVAALRARTCRSPSGVLNQPPVADAGRLSAQRPDARPARRRPSSSRNIVVKTDAERPGDAPPRRRPGRARRRGLRRQRLSRPQRRPAAADLPAAGRERAGDRERVLATMAGAGQGASRRACATTIIYNPTSSSPNRSTR